MFYKIENNRIVGQCNCQSEGFIYLPKEHIEESQKQETEKQLTLTDFAPDFLGRMTLKTYMETEDYQKELEAYNKTFELSYEELIVSKIRERYNVNQELAILRQRDTKPEEWEEYNNYVEECKYEVKTFGK